MSVARSSSSCDWMQARELSSVEHSASHPWWDAGPTSFMHLEPQPAVQPGGQVGVVEHAGLAPQPAQKSARKNEEAAAIVGCDGKRARLSKQSPNSSRNKSPTGRQGDNLGTSVQARATAEVANN